MKCTFRVDKKINPDDMGVDRNTGAKFPVGGKYNRPKLDAVGKQIFDNVDGAPVAAVEQGAFVQVLLTACDDDDECHERTAHGYLHLLDLTETAGAEFEPGAEYEVTITRKK